MPCAPQSCRDVANSLRSNSATSFFGSFSGARLRPMGILFLPPFVLPRLADGGGKRRGFFGGQSRFFPAPPSREEVGEPRGAGIGWGALFLFLLLGTQKKK